MAFVDGVEEWDQIVRGSLMHVVIHESGHAIREVDVANRTGCETQQPLRGGKGSETRIIPRVRNVELHRWHSPTDVYKAPGLECLTGSDHLEMRQTRTLRAQLPDMSERRERRRLKCVNES